MREEEFIVNERTIFRGGLLVLPGNVIKADLIIEGEKISGIIAQNQEADGWSIDVKGKVLFPGLIDTHVHMWSPSPMDYREDWYHGTRCAASGGVTTVVEMPLSVPPVTDEKSLRNKQEIAEENACVDFALWGGLIPDCVNNLSELNEMGCVAYKGFMSFAGPEYPQITDGYLVKGMEIAKTFDGLIGVHAENAEVADFGSKEMSKRGETDPAKHDEARPWWVELEAIQRAVLFTEAMGNRLYICHMTIKEGAEYLKAAKARGVKVFVETCPHYLIFDKNILREKGAYAKCNPPFRSRENVESLWKYIFDGTIDTIGSDHGPYTDKEKTQNGDFFKEYCGFGSSDAMFAGLITEGVHKRGLSLERLAQLTSENAARIMGLYPRKGSLLPGRDADIAVVDLNEEWTFDGTKSFSKQKSPNNVYHGMKMIGRVKQTWVRGRSVYEDGKIIEGSKGYGEYIRKNKKSWGT